MMYSTRVQQRVCIQANHWVPLRTTKRTLTWPYAGPRVCVPVSGGQGVAGSNPAVPTGQMYFSFIGSGANWGANGFPEAGQPAWWHSPSGMRFIAVAL
jgi:hypothetical protein